MRFSERIGKRPVKTVLQVDSIDEDLKNGLWNVIFEYFNILDIIPKLKLVKSIWKDFYKKPIDEMPKIPFSSNVSSAETIKYIKSWYVQAEWDQVYDFVEFLFSKDDRLIALFNKVLETEVSGYRIINGIVVQITSEEEVQEIEQVLDETNKWKSVNTHLRAALDFLADKKNPDYRNSIKESISAVESFCIIATNNPSITLGKALIELERNHSLHGSLKGAFSSLYGYTSDSGGIRHSLLEESVTPGFEEAKFMLVSCSAFINYLKAKMNL